MANHYSSFNKGTLTYRKKTKQQSRHVAPNCRSKQ
ncbi:hypothetical protein CCACVL1_03581 [Corchorus capsularis]|uniref:Uncharacterized protein n=1 Tax=Corchorus capsularis TaxID=210143 RepID=A0A1R3JYE4_COCAP|nr:hypothetical protein CCACVL1_03581 [Corchorus capsularis]